MNKQEKSDNITSSQNGKIKVCSVFSGIGGFELGIIRAIGERADFVAFSEIDKYAIQTYQYNFPNHKSYGDITKIDPDTLPDFDCFVGGPPCQSFSIAGKRGGFDDTRGTLFFDCARIIGAKRPRNFVLENVKGLLSHSQGETFKTIIRTLTDLGYCVEWQVLNSKNFGVPQNRERVFIVGHRENTRQSGIFPLESIHEKRITDEKVYILPEKFSKNRGVFLLLLEQGKGQEVSKPKMQNLLSEIRQGIQKGECVEVQRNTENLVEKSEGGIQNIEELKGEGAQGFNITGGVCGVVQIPTEEVLLLWDKGGEHSISFRRIQQQDFTFDCGQDGLVKKLQRGEPSPLLLAVQPYKERLFYSIGDGRNWQKIYISKMESKCSTTLSSILEESPDEKYFLSEKMVEKLISTSSTNQNTQMIESTDRTE